MAKTKSRLDDFERLVEKMRIAQRKFLRTGNTNDKEEATRLEKEVDGHIRSKREEGDWCGVL